MMHFHIMMDPVVFVPFVTSRIPSPLVPFLHQWKINIFDTDNIAPLIDCVTMRHFSLLEFTPNLEATLLGSVGICSNTPYITLDTNTPKIIFSDGSCFPPQTDNFLLPEVPITADFGSQESRLVKRAMVPGADHTPQSRDILPNLGPASCQSCPNLVWLFSCCKCSRNYD